MKEDTESNVELTERGTRWKGECTLAARSAMTFFVCEVAFLRGGSAATLASCLSPNCEIADTGNAGPGRPLPSEYVISQSTYLHIHCLSP